MTIIRLIGFVLLAATFQAHAGKNPTKAVEAQVEALKVAMVDAAKKALTALTLPELTYGHSSGREEDRAAFIENIVNGNSNFETMDLLDQTVKVHGDVAIVRHILSGTTNDKGKGPGDVKIGVMLVWKKHKSDWLLLARQAYKLPQ